MSRAINRLTAAKVRALKNPSAYADGNGLYLQVKHNSKAWVLRYMRNGRAHTMGLGSATDVSLAQARDRAQAARSLLSDNVDPIQQRRIERRLAETPTFRDAAASYIATHRDSWRNAKHASQWENTLAMYVSPKIGDLSVKDITADHVLSVLQPIWHTKPETASRVRARIERILDWATSRGYREGVNPARWSGHLKFLLPSRLRRSQNHPALPWSELQGFWADLMVQSGLAPKALLFTIRCANERGSRCSVVRN